jgi:hypothetical protein
VASTKSRARTAAELMVFGGATVMAGAFATRFAIAPELVTRGIVVTALGLFIFATGLLAEVLP